MKKTKTGGSVNKIKSINTGIFKKGHKINNGRIISEETRLKMSKAQKMIGNKPPSMLGKKHSDETREKIREAHKSRLKIYGYINSKETREKISKSLTGRKQPKEVIEKRIKRGDKHYNWKGGISNNPYPLDWKDDLRNSVRKRDNFTCQIPHCHKKQEELTGVFKRLSVHHIDYNKNNINPDNLITLCMNCHLKTNHNRGYWKKYFEEKMYLINT